jgi:hypothetical protein
MRGRISSVAVAVAAALVLAHAAPGAARAPCDLRLILGPRSQSPPGQFHASLVLRDQDLPPATCRVSGFPDVELIGPDFPVFGTIYFVPDSSGHPRSVTLRPGQSAHAVLTWLPSSLAPSARWSPGYVRVVVATDRGGGTPLAVRWPFGSVERQDAATHPGTYVGPIAPGAG